MGKKYYRQLHSHDCGPTAVVNAMVWAGLRAGRNTIRRLIKEMGCDLDMGTTNGSMTRALKKKGILGRYVVRDRARALEGHIESGGAAVVLTYIGECDSTYWWHYSMIVGTKKRGVYREINTANRRLNGHFPKISKKLILKKISQNGKCAGARAWLIRKPRARR